MNHYDAEKIVSRLAKEDCGDCINTPCSYCAKMKRFGMKVVDAILSERSKVPDALCGRPGQSEEFEEGDDD